MTREVEKRIEDLTHQIHREILGRSVEQVKTLAPILICSMKIFIQIISQGPYYFLEQILYSKLPFNVEIDLQRIRNLSLTMFISWCQRWRGSSRKS